LATNDRNITIPRQPRAKSRNWLSDPEGRTRPAARNIAARVQAVAAPGAVVMTDAAHRLVSGLFVVEDGGAQALKGIDRPVQLYRLVQPSGVRGRLQAAAAPRCRSVSC
jgi:hypothetical protein